MRKGFSLVEVLILVVVLPFVFLLFDGLFKTLIGEIPMSVRLIEENTSVLNVLRQIQKDIDIAKGLPKSFAGQTASDHVLLIELADDVISYQIKDGLIIRQKLADKLEEQIEAERVWSIPHANVHWKVWEKNGQGYAVETNTHLEYGRKGQWKKKMAHTHLYFAGAIGNGIR